eukprot:85217-Lingulodinium_polyedra.AAC.1
MPSWPRGPRPPRGKIGWQRCRPGVPRRRCRTCPARRLRTGRGPRPSALALTASIGWPLAR